MLRLLAKIHTKVIAPPGLPITDILLNEAIVLPRKCAGSQMSLIPLYWRKPDASNTGIAPGPFMLVAVDQTLRGGIIIM